jgi:hypothetical protein
LLPSLWWGTPGRIVALAREKDISLKNVRHSILDECDKIIESVGKFLSSFLPCIEFSGNIFIYMMCGSVGSAKLFAVYSQLALVMYIVFLELSSYSPTCHVLYVTVPG